MDDVLTVDEAAALAKLPPWTIRRMVREGVLPAGRTSAGAKSHIRIARSAVDAWLHAPGAMRAEDV